MEGTIDEVIVKVTGKVDKSSADNINSLAESLGKLKQSLKGGYHNLNKLASGLQELKTNATGLAQLNKSLSAVQGIADALKPLETITSPKGLTKTIKNLQLLPEVIAKITPDTLQNVARVANELSVALTPLANKFADIAVGFSSLQALANKYGVSVTKITEGTAKAINKMTLLKKVVEAIKSPFAALSTSTNLFRKSTEKGFDKLISKTKQLGLSLLGTRSIFTATRKAISEYMQMDEELTKATTNLWRALGAQLAPAVELVLYLFKQFTRAVYSFVYAITGVDLIARANAKAMAGWGKSAKDTLGNLQKFDDLNVADFGKGNGDNALIELDKIDLSPIQWIIDATIRIKNAFKEAFDTGQWKGVGKELANLVNEFTTRLKPDKIFGAIENVAIQIGNFINGWFENINAEDLGKAIQTSLLILPKFINKLLSEVEWDIVGEKITNSLSNINFKEIIENWGRIVTSLFDGLQTALLNIDSSTLSKAISQIVLGFGSAINTFLTTIKWNEIGLKLHDVIIGMDWKSIFKAIGDILLNVLSGIGGLVGGTLFGTEFKNKASSAFAGIGLILGGILIKVFGVTIFTKLGTLIKKLFKSSGLGKIKVSGNDISKNTFELPKASTILKGLGELALIIGGVTGIVLAVGELMRIPGFEKYTKKGLSLVVDVFKGIGSILSPLSVITIGVVGLGFANPLMVLSGLVGLGEIIAGVPSLLVAVGALMTIPNFTSYTLSGMTLVVSVFKGIESILVPLGAVCAGIITLGVASPIIVTSGLIGMGEILVGIIGVLDILSKLYDNSGFQKIVQDGGKALSMIGEVLGGFGGSIIKGFADKALENIPEYATKLSEFMENLQPFIDGIKGLDESSTKAVNNLADAILKITASNVIQGLTSWAKGKADLGSFAKDLQAFGPAFAKYADSVKDITSEKLEGSTNAAKMLSDFAANLPNHGGIVSWISGDNKLSDFGAEIEAFGSSFKSYYDNIINIDPKVVLASAEAANYLSTFASNIPDLVKNTTTAGGRITNTSKKLTEFGTELASFGASFKSYYDKVKNFDVKKLDNTTGALNAIVTELKTIKTNGLTETMKGFGTALANAASQIKSYFETSLSGSNGWSTGYNFGYNIGLGISSGLKNVSYPSLRIFGMNSTNQLGSYKIQAYETGTNEVPYEGLFHLHQGEAVVPKKYNPAVGGGYTGELDEKIDKLITIVENMDTTTTVNVGNKTLYEEQRRYNNFQRNKYGSIKV